MRCTHKDYNESMNIVLACDAFKGSLDSTTACNTLAEAIHEYSPAIATSCLPMADGGEGTADILSRHYGAEPIACQVQGPLTQQVINASFGWVSEQKLAIMDAASACGLPLIAHEQRNPMACTSYGLGQLMQAAINKGAQHIIVGLGGTATMDCGMGMLDALGWQVLDTSNQPIQPGAQGLNNLANILTPSVELPTLQILCDVTNPLLGQRGAARVFGKQKGASQSEIEYIEQGYQRFNMWCQHQGHDDISLVKYGGAAGGIAITAATMLGASLHSGSEFLANIYQLDNQIQTADLVISGEGCLDEQSLQGKVVSAIAKRCIQHNKPLWVFAGNVLLQANILAQHGISKAITINNPSLNLSDNLNRCQQHLSDALLATLTNTTQT